MQFHNMTITSSLELSTMLYYERGFYVRHS